MQVLDSIAESSIAQPLVLRVVTRLNVGGVSRHVLLLSRRLVETGYSTTLLAGSEDPGEGSLWEDQPYLHRIPELRRHLSPLDDLKARRTIRGYVDRQRPLIVHSHMAKAGALARTAARSLGVPVVIHTFHGHVLAEYFSKLQSRVFRETERRLAQKTDTLIAISSGVKDELLELGVGRADQWRVIPEGVELDELVGSDLAPADARARLGIADSAPIVGIVGRVAPIKNLDLFLDAATEVSRRLPQIRFVVAGDGEDRGRFQREAVSRLGDRISFLGWVEDLTSLYRALDVVILTSKSEGTPIALIEAAAAGVPAVATNVGGVTDVVVDGETGLLAAPNDVRRLAESLSSLLENPDLAQTMGSRARRHVIDRFSADRLVRDVSELYGELLRAKGLSPPTPAI